MTKLPEHEDDPELLDVARAVSDGAEVDWDNLESSAPRQQQPVIQQLRLISQVAFRHLDAQPLKYAAECEPHPPVIDSLPSKWGSLEIIEPVGSGAFGTVFRARDSQLEREVALKFFHPDRDGFNRRTSDLIAEGRLLARVHHPNVVTIFGAEHHEGRAGIWMEFVRGATLEEILTTEGPLDPAEAMRIGRDVCSGLAALQDEGIVHRDIKTKNVMREEDGRIVLMDLGVGCEIDSQIPVKQYGTPLYAAPEVLISNEADYQSDIYSVGVLLFHMVTGEYPVTGDSPADLREAHRTRDVRQLGDLRPDLPASFIRIVERALAPDTDKRFRSAKQLEGALTDALEPRTSAWRKPVTWLSLAVMATLVVTVWMWAPWRDDSEPLPEITPNLIAIAPLENRTGEPENDPFGLLASEAIIQRFVETGAAQTVAMSPDESLDESARDKGAAMVLAGACYRDGEFLRLRARLTDSDTGELMYTFNADSIANYSSATDIDVLADRIVAAVAAHLDPWIDITVMRPPASYAAFQVWQEGIDQWATDFDTVVSRFQQALELDPEFNLPRFWLIVAHWYASRIEEAKEVYAAAEGYLDRYTPFERCQFRIGGAILAGDPVAELNEYRQMVKLAPDLSWVRMQLADRAIGLNRPREAIEALEPHVATFAPTNIPFGYWAIDTFAATFHFVEDYEQQIAYADLGLEWFPDVGPLFRNKAAALAALGRIDAVNGVVADLLRTPTRAYSPGQVMIGVVTELDYHGHPEAAAEMAARCVEWFERQISESGYDSFTPGDRWSYTYALRLVDRWQGARDILIELENTGWAPLPVQGALGIIAANLGDRQEALRISEQLPLTPRPTSPAKRIYWQACIAAHLGEKDRAVALLGEAFTEGLYYVTGGMKPAHGWGIWPLHSDLDLSPLWHYPPFEAMVKPKG